MFGDSSIAWTDLLSVGLMGQSYCPRLGGLPFKTGLLCLSSSCIMHILCILLFITLYHETCNICSARFFVPLLASEEVTVQGKEGRKRAKLKLACEPGSAKRPLFQILSFVQNLTVVANEQACTPQQHVVCKQSLFPADFMFR